MTEDSRPWSGRVSEGAAGDAGPYSSSDWQLMYARMIGTGAENVNRGVMRGVLEELAVQAATPADTTVRVQTGAALVQGIWYLNDADLTVSIAANASGSTRIDIVVLEADYTAQTVRVDVVQGTPAAGVPALTQSAGTIWQIPLAYLTLASGFTSIASSAITDMRHYANVPSAVGVNVTNSSGATFEQGNVVIWLPAGGQAIDDSTTEGDRRVAGVIESRVLNGAVGRVITNGIVAVICDEAVAVGDLLEISTTAGQAQANLRGGVFGRVLTANTGAGTRCLAYINVMSDPATAITTTYTGNAAATQAITGFGFKPRAVIVYPNAVSGTNVGQATKTDRDGTYAFMTLVVGGAVDGAELDQIVSLDTDGITVGDGTGTANILNVGSRTYTIIAYR